MALWFDFGFLLLQKGRPDGT